MATKRKRTNVERTILCATRFWGFDAPRRGATGPTLLRGVKHVVREQGFATTTINKALTKLARLGAIELAGQRSGKTIRLTEKGGRVGCATVKLAPWTNDEYPGGALEGVATKKTPRKKKAPPRKKKAPRVLIGPGRPGQRFTYDDVEITTTLHPMRLRGLSGTSSEHLQHATYRMKHQNRNPSCQQLPMALFDMGTIMVHASESGNPKLLRMAAKRRDALLARAKHCEALRR